MLVSRILKRVVQEVAAELGRLFSCVRTFSNSGAVQAKADLAALVKACQSFVGRADKRNPFAEADKLIPAISTSENQEYV